MRSESRCGLKADAQDASFAPIPRRGGGIWTGPATVPSPFAARLLRPLQTPKAPPTAPPPRPPSRPGDCCCCKLGPRLRCAIDRSQVPGGARSGSARPRWLAILAPVLGGNGIWPWTQQAAAIQVRARGPCVEALQFNACSCLSRASGKRSDRQPLQHEGGPQRCLGKLLVVNYRAELGRWLEQKETAQRHTAEPRGAVHGAPPVGDGTIRDDSCSYTSVCVAR